MFRLLGDTFRHVADSVRVIAIPLKEGGAIE